jgi:hypothetical protein
MDWSLDKVNNFLAWSVNHPRELGVFVLLVHPVWLTILVALPCGCSCGAGANGRWWSPWSS